MTTSTLHAGAAPKPPSMRRLIVAATIGNVFEWFDFVVYGFFAVTLAEVFFPTGDPTVSLLVTFGAFGLAYIVRPRRVRQRRHLPRRAWRRAPRVQRQLAIRHRRHDHG